YDIYNRKIDFPIYPYSFKALFGFSKPTEFFRENNDDFALGFLQHLEQANCDFDAQFGYPCSPEEVPAKNPKVLVIEKKQ
ncbi:MAG: hypothetical protein GYA36_21360, partial [Veillonellaceae bacterium]|nr:hypothetical protein [Veillonellaceae bacterium]